MRERISCRGASRSIWHGWVVTREGSFEAGVDGAQPGIIMLADPQPGMSYRQEYLKGEAEDTGAIVSVGEEQVQVPAGISGGAPATTSWSASRAGDS